MKVYVRVGNQIKDWGLLIYSPEVRRPGGREQDEKSNKQTNIKQKRQRRNVKCEKIKKGSKKGERGSGRKDNVGFEIGFMSGPLLATVQTPKLSLSGVQTRKRDPLANSCMVCKCYQSLIHSKRRWMILHWNVVVGSNKRPGDV